MISEAPVLASTERAMTPGDILILVRSRGELAALIVARLFAAGVPVAGVDRLHLHEPLAVQDLLAAVRFAVQPNDDLSLACLLVSPLIGWDQDQLRSLAYGRKGSLWRELRSRAGDGEAFTTAHDELAELLRIADFITPSRFLETILSGPMQGRRKLYSRLGMASRDAIDELMNSALEFERNETPSLDRFLSWFSRGTVDVQRDPGQPANEVRVMTVHGAKGLEAPVVILADATADPARLGRTPLTVDVEVEGEERRRCCAPEGRAMCAVRRNYHRAGAARPRGAFSAALRRPDPRRGPADRQRRPPKERKDGADPRPMNCWHRVVEQAMLGMRWSGRRSSCRPELRVGRSPRPSAARRRSSCQSQPFRTGRQPRHRRKRARRVRSLPLASPPTTKARRRRARRCALLRCAARGSTSCWSGCRRSRPRRGRRRPIAGSSDRRASPIASARAEIVDQVCGIISDARFARLFGPGSLGEAPLAATLPDGRVIAGTVDRLLVDEDAGRSDRLQDRASSRKRRAKSPTPTGRR